VILLPLIAGIASAVAGDGPWSLAVGAGAELPVSTGVHTTLEGPGRLRVGGSVGRLPGVLIYGASEASASLGLVDDEGAAAVGETASSAWVLGGSVGWRPFEAAGLWVAGDLRHLRCDSTASPELVATALGVSDAAISAAKSASDADPSLSPDPYAMSMRATLLGGSVGWDWLLAERVVVRFSAGGLGLRSARTVLEPGDGARPPERKVVDEANQGLEELSSRRFFTPTLGLGVGWQFG